MRELFYRVEALLVLKVGMNIGVVKITRWFETVLFHPEIGIEGARRTAYVEKDLHGLRNAERMQHRAWSLAFALCPLPFALCSMPITTASPARTPASSCRNIHMRDSSPACRAGCGRGSLPAGGTVRTHPPA